jgi:hypothetical protein
MKRFTVGHIAFYKQATKQWWSGRIGGVAGPTATRRRPDRRNDSDRGTGGSSLDVRRRDAETKRQSYFADGFFYVFTFGLYC